MTHDRRRPEPIRHESFRAISTTHSAGSKAPAGIRIWTAPVSLDSLRTEVVALPTAGRSVPFVRLGCKGQTGAPMSRDRFDEIIRPGRDRYMAMHSIGEWIGRPISDDEATGFLAAVDAGLVRLSGDRLAIDLIGFPPFSKTKRYRLFGHWEGRAYWSWQEAFIQIAFAAELVLLHAWPPGRVGIETGLDVAVLGPEGMPPVLLAEAKVDPRDLKYVMTVMTAIADDPAAYAQANPRGRDGNAVNKYTALARYRPLHYVEVAPHVRRVHKLTFVDREDPRRPAISFDPSDVVPAGP